MRKKLLTASICCLLFLGPAWAQQGGQSQTPQTGGGRQPANSPGPLPPILLIGRVIFDDGTRPQEPVLVEMLCYGEVRRQTYAIRGQFSLQFGTSRPVTFMDSSVSDAAQDDEFFQANRLGVDRPSQAFSKNVLNNLDLSGCELRARLPGFQSERIQLGRRRPLDTPDVGEIVLHRLSDVGDTTVSVTTLRAPKKAKKAYENAQKELKKKKASPSRARRELENAVKVFPEFAAAWHLLGEVRLTRKDSTGARQAFEKAIAADPEYVLPYLSLAKLEVEQGRWEDAAKWSSGVIELNPHIMYAHYLSAAANYSLGKLDLAEEAVQEVQKSGEAQRYPVTYFILGGILAQRGNIPSATAEFNRFLQVQPEGPLAQQSKQILAEWERRGLIGKESVAAPED